jgi:hypothetical protein
VIYKEMNTGIKQPKTETELMQELLGGHSKDFTARSNSNI